MLWFRTGVQGDRLAVALLDSWEEFQHNMLQSISKLVRLFERVGLAVPSSVDIHTSWGRNFYLHILGERHRRIPSQASSQQIKQDLASLAPVLQTPTSKKQEELKERLELAGQRLRFEAR